MLVRVNRKPNLEIAQPKTNGKIQKKNIISAVKWFIALFSIFCLFFIHAIKQNVDNIHNSLNSVSQYDIADYPEHQIIVDGNLFAGLNNSNIKDLAKVSKMGLTTVPEISIINEGATITLKEVYYDKSQIALGLEFKEFSDYNSFYTAFFQNNIEIVPKSAFGKNFPVSDNLHYKVIRYRFLDNLPDKFDFHIIIKEQVDLKREFAFTVRLDRTAANSLTSDLLINKTYQIGDNTEVFIKRLLFTPAATYIEYDLLKPIRLINFDNLNIDLKIQDSQGNIIELTGLTAGGTFNNDRQVVSYYAFYSPCDEVPRELKCQFFKHGTNKPMFSPFSIDLIR